MKPSTTISDVSLALATPKDRKDKWLKNLFITAFPAEERPPYFFLRWRALDFVDWWIILYNGVKVGFFYVIRHCDHAYLLFLAIDPKYRKKGIGTIALNKLLTHYSDFNIFLAIEQLDIQAQNYDERVKRKQFYLNCGLRDMQQHMQELSVHYDVLSTKKLVDKTLFVELMHKWLIWPLNKLLTIKIY